MIHFKTQSEKYFAEYLDRLGLFYDYEKSWGGKTPDFTIFSNKSKNTIIAIADNKESDYTKHEKKILRETGRIIRSSNPYTGIRSKINAARKQFMYAKEYPCIPIIYSLGPAMATPLIIYGAMLGDIGISIPIKSGGGQDSSRKTHSFFGKGGKMIDEKHGQLQNKTITGIGILGHTKPESVISGYEDELKKRLKSVSIEEEDWLDKTQKIVDELTQKMKNKGFNHLERTAPSVDFIVNPFARLPFPKKFFEKGYTYIHEYDTNTGKIKLTYDWTKQFSSPV